MTNRLTIATLAGLGIMLGSASTWADGTETLGPPSIAIAPGTGIAAAGVGLAAGPGTISIDVPVGASVEQVLLYWSCLAIPGNQDDSVTVNLTPVVGTKIGGETTFFSNIQGASFRADITALGVVTDGNSMVDIAGLDDCDDGASSLDVNNGAGLLVIFDDGVSALANIEVRDGNDMAFVNFAPPLDGTVPQTFGFAASAVDRTADLAMFFGSVSPNEFRPNAFDVTVDGTTMSFDDLLGSNDGDEWDTVNISILVPAGATMLTVQAFSADRNGTGRFRRLSSGPAPRWLSGRTSLPASTAGSRAVAAISRSMAFGSRRACNSTATCVTRTTSRSTGRAIRSICST